MAPAIMPSLIPITLPIPSKAKPTVPIVLHELPVAKATIAQIIHVATRK